MEFSSFTDKELKEEIEAIQLALNAPLRNPFDGSEARLHLKLEAAKKELDKRHANGT